jgi:dTDP-4-dehydrorhamnose 3,5-epimerase
MAGETAAPGGRLIEGVALKGLRLIPDERGFLMEILRADDPLFERFGQIYLSVAYPGVVKGWHYHRKQTDMFCVVKGMMKVALYDPRPDSPTRGAVNEFFLGERNPALLRIPPLVVHGMKAIGTEPGYLLNCPTEPYAYAEPDEFRIDPHDNDIPYDWARRDG